MIDLGVQNKKIYYTKETFFSLTLFSFELLLEFNPQLKSCDLCMKSVRVDETDAGLPVVVCTHTGCEPSGRINSMNQHF